MATRTSGTHVWLVLMKAHRTLRRVAAGSIATNGIGLSDFAILELLLHKGAHPVNAIGRTIDLTSGAITTAVDRLESRRLVERGADPNDRRTRIVRLTPAGRAQITAVFAAHEAAMDAVGAELSASERTTLANLLKKLGTAAVSHIPSGEEP